ELFKLGFGRDLEALGIDSRLALLAQVPIDLSVQRLPGVHGAPHGSAALSVSKGAGVLLYPAPSAAQSMLFRGSTGKRLPPPIGMFFIPYISNSRYQGLLTIRSQGVDARDSLPTPAAPFE